MTNICRSVIFYLGIIISTQVSALDSSISPITKPTFGTSVLSPETSFETPPTITGFGTAGCVSQGDSLTVLGRNFGRKSSIALGGSGLPITLQTTFWGTSKIITSLPLHRSITPGARFFVAIKKSDSSTWLSNTDKYISICKSEPVETMAPKSTSEQFVPDSPDEPEINDGNDTGDFRSQAVLPSGSGSLINLGLPTPPENLKLLSRKVSESQIEPNELLVISNDMNQARELAQQLGQFGLRARARKKLQNLGVVMSKFIAPADIDLQQTAINIRAAFPEMWADVNHRYTLLAGKRNTAAERKIINWSKKDSKCGVGLRIGLLDTGLNTSHSALQKQSIVEQSIITHGMKKAGTDHGTAIAGLLVGDNRSTFAGLLPSAQLYVAAVFRQRDKNNIDTTSEWVINAIDWLISQKVHVINMSIGGPPNLLVDIAIHRSMRIGIAVIAAAGNGGKDGEAVFPAAQPGVIAVSALDRNNRLYKKANHGEYIDFAAPGVDIWTANSKGKGQYVSGTSYATAFVTGSIARLMRKSGARDAYTRLQETAVDLGDKGKDRQFGWGLIQAPENCL